MVKIDRFNFFFFRIWPDPNQVFLQRAADGDRLWNLLLDLALPGLTYVKNLLEKIGRGPLLRLS